MQHCAAFARRGFAQWSAHVPSVSSPMQERKSLEICIISSSLRLGLRYHFTVRVEMIQCTWNVPHCCTQRKRWIDESRTLFLSLLVVSEVCHVSSKCKVQPRTCRRSCARMYWDQSTVMERKQSLVPRDDSRMSGLSLNALFRSRTRTRTWL